MSPLLRRVAFFCSIFTMQCAVNVLGNISRDAIFLRSYKASSISTLTLFLSCSSAYILTTVNSKQSQLAQRSDISNGLLYAICPSLLSAGLFILSITSLFLPFLARFTSVAIYIWIEIGIQILSGQFWDLCAKAFDVGQSKKYFGFITFGTTFGTLLASIIILPALQAHALSTEYNLIIAACLQIAMAAVLYTTADQFVLSRECPDPRNKSHKGTSSFSMIFSDIQARTYLQHICLFDLLATIMRVLIDNTTLSVLSLQEDENEVKNALTMINSVQSILMIPLQLASGPFFTHFGVMYGIAMLPLSIICFGMMTWTTSSPMSLVYTRALYNAVSMAIFNPARELLWLPFQAQDRSRFKSFVVGPFRSVSRIVGAVLSIIFTMRLMLQWVGPSFMSTLMILASIIWIFVAFAARQSYAAEFYASLKQGHLDLTSPLIDFTPDQLVLVKDTLINGASHQVQFVLSCLSQVHVSMVGKELRELFHRRQKEDPTLSLTPLHIKLRLLNLHTTAKRAFVLSTQESLFRRVDSSTTTLVSTQAGFLNTMDLMMLIKEKSIYTPRPLRVAAILACGYEQYSPDVEQCSHILKSILENVEEDKSVIVCAAVALLRLSEWMDEEANVVLQRLLHEDRDGLDSKVICLRIVGKELPELLGDGFLVYLLHHSSPLIIHAAVECCSNSARHSKMLIPALMKQLSNSSLRAHVVAALKVGFDPSAVWMTLTQYIESTLEISINRRDALAGALQVLEQGHFPIDDKLEVVLHILHRVVYPKEEVNDKDPLFRLCGGDSFVEELVVDTLLTLVRGTEVMSPTIRQELHQIHMVLQLKLRQAYEMRHVLSLFHELCPRTATNIEDTSPLLLQHVEHSVEDTIRIVLKLLSIEFPQAFDVSVILEGLQSDVVQVHAAIQEVLENLLPTIYKNIVLVLLFPSTTPSKATLKLMHDIKEGFGGRLGIDVLLETMHCKQQHVELSCLALQYYLHVAQDHSSLITEDLKRDFEQNVLAKGLLKNELARELLIETYHSHRHVLPYESLVDLRDCTPPLISKIAISNCLRVSALFEKVCAIGILRILAHHFVPVKVEQGETFMVEGQLATSMCVIADGRVQLHKGRRVLAEVGYGTCVGQAALLQHSLHEGKHIASATAVTNCTLLSISRSNLDALMHQTPRVSRGVLHAVASSLRWLYFEPLNTIAQSGSLPRRDRRTSSIRRSSSLSRERSVSLDDYNHSNMLERTKSMSSSLKAAMSLDRAAKSFLSLVGRPRGIDPPLAALKLQRNRSLQMLSSSGAQGRRRSEMSLVFGGRYDSDNDTVIGSQGLLSAPLDGSDYSTFEKSIHLKATLCKVITLEHRQVLYEHGAPSLHVFVVIEGTISIVDQHESAIEQRPGECFGEESFVDCTTTHGCARAVGRVTLFQIPTKELVDLSELHADLMHVLLAWISQKLAKATEGMVAPFLSPIDGIDKDKGQHWTEAPLYELNDQPEQTLTQRVRHK